MDLNHIIKEIVSHNDWLNGYYDAVDGDPFEMLEKQDKFSKCVELNDLKRLFNELNNYDGVWKYKNLLFFNDYHYGCFVYDVSNTKNYIEHFSIHAMSLENFVKAVSSLVK